MASLFGAADMFQWTMELSLLMKLRELGNQFGISIKHTTGYSPWANGLNDHNHATIYMRMERMLENSPNLDETLALNYAASVRNCCLFVNRFTPCQLAIGQNPKLPSPFYENLPALEGCITSPTITEHLNVIANTQKAFNQIETSCKLKRVLKHPVRSYCDIK